MKVKFKNINKIPKRFTEYAEDVLSGKIIACQNIILACQRYLDWLDRPDFWFNQELADKISDFFMHLRHFDDDYAGKPFILADWQRFCVYNIFCFFRADDHEARIIHNAVMMISRKNGKALSLDTKLYTPDGTTTMRQVQVGDIIMGADGKPTRVTYATPVMQNHDCYRVTFEDGESIIADAEHNWLVKKKGKSISEVMITAEMISDFKHVRRDGKGVEYKYRVPMNKPVEYSPKVFAMDPYVLGLWLGDGISREPIICTDIDDVPIYDCMKSVYGEPKIRLDKRGGRGVEIIYTGDPGKNNSLFRHQLAALNLLGNKHIPTEYLYGSIEQRFALLQGLMDSDGSVSESGECEFNQKNKAVADGFCTLLSNLGIKFTRTTKIPTIYGKVCDEVERIRFYTDKTFPCFRLKRKFDRLKDHLNKRMQYKSIINIEKVESVPVRCITVDNADHLYLCGERCTVTHNTAFAAGMMLADLLICSKGVFSSYLIANTRDQAKTIFRFVKGFVHSLDPKQKKIRVYRDYITIKKKGTAIESVVKVLSADSSKLDGLGPDSFILDEQGAAPNFDNFNILKSGQGAKKNPLSITISSAGFLVGEQYPLYQNVQVGSKVLRGDLQDDTSFYALYQLDDESEWQDEKCWKKCCPNYGVTVSKAFMEERINEANNFGGSKLTDVKTKNFNIFCDSAEVWIQQEFLQKCHAKIPLDELKGSTAYLGVDLSSTRDLTALAICFPPDEYRTFYPDRYIFKTWCWIPKWAVNNSRNKKMYQWFIQNHYATMTAGNSVDYDAVLKLMKELTEEFCIAGIMFDPWNSAQWAQNSAAEGFIMIPVSQSIGSMNRATKALEINVLNEKVIFELNPLLSWCFANCAIKTDYNGNQKPVKSDDDVKKIDPVIAILNALMGPLLEQLGGDYGVIDLPFTNQSS